MLEPEKAPATLNKKELKKARPEVYDSWIDEGVQIERIRIKKLTEMKKQPEYKQLPKVLATIDKAIFDGTALDKVPALIMAVILKVANDPAKALAAAQESPGDIQGGDGEYTTSVYPGSAGVGVSGRGQPVGIPGAPVRGQAAEKLITEV